MNFINYVHWFLYTCLLCLFCCTVKYRRQKTTKLKTKQKKFGFSLESPKQLKSLAWWPWPHVIYLDLWGRFNNYPQLLFCRDSNNLEPRQRRDGLTLNWEKMPLKRNTLAYGPCSNHVVNGRTTCLFHWFLKSKFLYSYYLLLLVFVLPNNS